MSNFIVALNELTPRWYDATFPFDRGMIDEFKKIPGATWQPEKKRWKIPHHALPVLDRLGIRHQVLSRSMRNYPQPLAALMPALRPYQQQDLKVMLNEPAFILAYDMRVGKGLVAGTPVVTPSGYVPVELLHVGDQLFGRDGKIERIEGVYARGTQQVYDVEFNDGAVLRVDGDHLWTVSTANARSRGGASETISTDELIRRGLTRRGTTGFEFSVPVHDALDFQNAGSGKWQIASPYALGAMLGDGSFSAAHGLEFCKPDELIATAVAHSFGLSDLTAKVTKTRSRTWYVPAAQYQMFENYGLIGTDSYSKFIPAAVFTARKEDRQAVLAGLLDTDGTVGPRKSTVEFSTSSRALAEGVTTLARGLGCIVTMTSRFPKYDYKGEKLVGALNYRLWIRSPINPFYANVRNKQNWYAPTMCRSIVAIRPVGRESTFCIKTSAKDGLFVAGREHIVTHNTPTAAVGIASALAHGYIRTAVVMYPNTVRAEWERQFPKFTMGLPFHAVEGTEDFNAARFESVPYLVLGMHYELLRAEGAKDDDGNFNMNPIVREVLNLVYRRGPSLAVADEPHLLVKRKSPRAQLFIKVGAMSAQRWVLDGTPLRSRPRDMFPIWEFLQAGSMGSFSKYTGRYANGHMGEHGWEDKGKSNEEELKSRLHSLWVARTRREVAPWLPKADRQVILCDMSKAQLQAYRAQETALAPHILNAINNEGEASGQAKAAMRHLSDSTSIAKMPRMLERVRHHVEGRNVKVLVFALHHETLTKAWATLRDASEVKGDPFKAPVFIAGGWMQPDKRRSEIAKWMEYKGPAVLMVNSLSSGIGIDLSDADVAIGLETAWVPADFLQMEARIEDVHLGKRTSPPLLEYLLARGTVDEDMVTKLITKLATVESVTGGNAHSAEVEDTLRNAGVVDRSILSLAREDDETVGNAIDELRARLAEAAADPNLYDTGDNADADEEADEDEQEDENDGD
ncbi:MAG: SNF2-related protein [Minisyncoccia bacterium]